MFFAHQLRDDSYVAVDVSTNIDPLAAVRYTRNDYVRNMHYISEHVRSELSAGVVLTLNAETELEIGHDSRHALNICHIVAQF